MPCYHVGGAIVCGKLGPKCRDCSGRRFVPLRLPGWRHDVQPADVRGAREAGGTESALLQAARCGGAKCYPKAKLSSYTPRRELHGEDPRPAATLKFDIVLGADMLLMFHPTLRSALFEHREGVVRNLADAASTANDLRYPQIGKPLTWTLELIGAELTIDYGLGGKSNIVLPDCTVDDFTISPQQGAVAFVGFRVACHPDEKQSGKLAMMIGKDDLKITLAPPAAEQDLAGERPPKGRSRKAVDEQMAGAA